MFLLALILTGCYPGPDWEAPYTAPEDVVTTSCEPAEVYCRFASDRWSWEDCGYQADGSDCDGWDDMQACRWEVPHEDGTTHTEILEWYLPEDGCPTLTGHWSD